MKRITHISLVFFALTTTSCPLWGQSSVLSTGTWSKLGIEEAGIYKITFDQLRTMGFDMASVDPSTIKIYGNRGGMLPQANSVARPSDLTEIAIFVEGEDDGTFDPADFILFYGEGPDRADLNTTKEIFYYENNLYSDKNFYFITVEGAGGKRVSVSPNEDAEGFEVTTFNDFFIHETDSHNELKSGREWFGETFGVNTNELTQTYEIAGIVGESTIKVVSGVLGQSLSTTSFDLFFNDVKIGQQSIAPIPNSTYGIKGTYRRDTFLIDAASVNAAEASTQNFRYAFTKGTGSSKAFLDFLLVSIERELELYGDQTIFQSIETGRHEYCSFRIDASGSTVSVWDISDPSNVRSQSYSKSGEIVSFTVATDPDSRYVVFNNNVPSPLLEGAVANQNLHGLNTPNLVIVTHPDFEAEAERLATHRQSFSGWSVAVISTDKVYNEFSSGRQDVSAIRDFARYLYDRNPSALKALLLFGKGSYDYKDRVTGNTNFVPIYESRNSLEPLATYCSDDYFTFLEDDEGIWSEGPAVNHTMDIGVGRLPVTTPEEAKTVVDKIIDYDTNDENFGVWQKEIVFVADDGNGDDNYSRNHQLHADDLSNYVEQNEPSIDSKKLFMGSFAKEVRPGGESVPKLSQDIIRAFDRGALIINYSGHGNEEQWADEDIFNLEHISELDNRRLPFLVTATCDFGWHDNPQKTSGAEKAVNLKGGGAIGTVTTTRTVYSTSNFMLNIAFYEALFERNENAYLSLGEVFRQTKNNSFSGVNNRNFALLGDPSMTLALPPNVVTITSLKTALGSDTLKALSTVTAIGEITDAQGGKLSDFNGTLELTLFDKEIRHVTTGRNNPQVEYEQWNNALFRGKATIKDGEFSVDFMLPKNIAYNINAGKLSLYASHREKNMQAKGAFSDFKVGGTEVGVVTESTPPEISLFIGDTTFINGGVTTPDTWLIANLRDESGINISSYGIGNSIIAVLDDNAQSFILNDYYIADKDDATSGWINYPMKDLPAGKHSLTITVWDIFNNSSSAQIEFFVTDGQVLTIESFGNYPNPFTEKTTVFFTHNRSGDDLQAQLFILNARGEVVTSAETIIPQSSYQVDLLQIDNAGSEKKLSAGLYFARLIVRSLSNGSKNEQVTKLIILN